MERFTISDKDFDRRHKPIGKVDGHQYKNIYVAHEDDYPQYSVMPYFEQVVEFAQAVGKFDQFKDWVLDYLENYSGRPHRVVLYKDFAPYSFGFSLFEPDPDEEDSWKLWFGGGIIYHGPHDRGGDGGAPTFAVSLTPADGWSIHT